MFKKILIANRGEIACRVIKSAQKMGIKAVAVYSDADRNALHVQMADEAYYIGESPANASYLVIDKILEAIKETDAEAVHPGYGFLSENSHFAKILQENNIAFIGPNIEAIEVMGDKIASKKYAMKSGVSTVPGYVGEISDSVEALKISKEIGFPVMIKASAGGGGKGMRVARNEDEVKTGFDSSRNEAKSSFGDDRIFIEKYIEKPRHIEIQIMADKFGNVVYLFERECSIQRRNQKVVEEAPSSFVDEKMRKHMGEQAVGLAKAVKYESAGTVEFIVDVDYNFYFLEMNTRLQVEHPVTEMITGIDLVEAMIKVAASEKLSFSQNDIQISGWAIESRIYAEDPYRDFLPSTGRLKIYSPPEELKREDKEIRNDTGVYEGSEISIYYDPMISKLCTFGKNRQEAIRLMSKALDRYVIKGIQHNIPFLSSIMTNPKWLSGKISTNFIAEEYHDGFSGANISQKDLEYFAFIATSMDNILNQRKNKITGQISAGRVTFSNNRSVKIGDKFIDIRISENLPSQIKMDLIDENTEVSNSVMVTSDWVGGDNIWDGKIDDDIYIVQVEMVPNGFSLFYRGMKVLAHVYSEAEARLVKLMPERKEIDTSNLLLCPMPGMVVSLNVEEGEKVRAGQALCVVEAMKMENILYAERDVSVKNICCEVGASLMVDEVIMEFYK